MWFTRRRKQDDSAHIDAQVKAIQKDMFSKIDTATDKLRKVNDLFDEPVATAMIFAAMGGKAKQHGKH